MKPRPARCFNCEGRGTDILYYNVESIVYADAGNWLTSPMLDFYIIPCPYCAHEDDDLPLLPPWGWT